MQRFRVYLFLLCSILVLVSVRAYTRPSTIVPNFEVTLSLSRDRVERIDQQRNVSSRNKFFVDVLRFDPAEMLTHVHLGKLGARENYFLDFAGNFEVLADRVFAFGVKSDDGFRLLIDGAVVLESPERRAYALSQVELPLSKGLHRIELNYFQCDGTQGISAGYQLREEQKLYRMGEGSAYIRFVPFTR